MSTTKYSERHYVNYDPFAGDEGVDIKCREVKVVRVKKPHQCWTSLSPDSTPHEIKIGEQARYEGALVDGAWAGYYVCLPCMDKWLDSVMV